MDSVDRKKSDMSTHAELVAIEAMADKIAKLEGELARLKPLVIEAEKSSLPDQIRALRGRGIILLNLRSEAEDVLAKELTEAFGVRLAEAVVDDMFTMNNAPCAPGLREEMKAVFNHGMSRFFGRTEIEQRASAALVDAFCRIGLLSRRLISEEGIKYLFLISDAAHNIPAALAGDRYHGPDLERDVLALEALLEESATTHLELPVPDRRSSIFARLGAFIGFGSGRNSNA